MRAIQTFPYIQTKEYSSSPIPATEKYIYISFSLITFQKIVRYSTPEANRYRCVKKSLSTDFSSCTDNPHELLKRILRIPQSHSPICKVLFTIPGLDPIQGILNGSKVRNELIRIKDVTWNRPHF
ncbi:hypothetical protein TcCL_Unassigned00507, partial [Trypanosoma cruzi]